MEFFSFSYEVDICILASQQVLAFEFFRYEYDFGQSPIYMCIYIYITQSGQLEEKPWTMGIAPNYY